MLGGLSAGGGKKIGIRAALFRSSTAKGITLSNATKAHPVVLFLFVSVCISLPLSAPRSFRFSPLLLVASPSSPYLTLSLAPSFSFYFSPSLALFPRVVFLSFLFCFSLSRHFFLSLSLSCCSSAAVLLTLGRQRAGEKSPRPPKDWRERASDETDLGGGKQDNRANTTQIRSRRAAGRGTESQREKLTAPQGLPGRSPAPVLTGPCAA